MNVALLIIGIAALAFVIFAIYRSTKVKRQYKEINARRYERIKPLYEKLDKAREIDQKEILAMASNALTRAATFLLLQEHGKSELFPKEFYSIEKGAESYLANWLEFPTELDACPDEMEHVKKVTIDFDNNNAHYHVFKFRISEPHWAAKNGWMIGVAGPYFDESEPYHSPRATFSRLSSKFETTSPEEEAKWVHENISMRRG